MTERCPRRKRVRHVMCKIILDDTDFLWRKRMRQTPEPGKHLLFFRGDTISFTLDMDSPLKGKAFVRTNIGNAQIQHDEIIRSVESDIPSDGIDWHDIQMSTDDNKTFRITIALAEVGHFEAKCFFCTEDSEETFWCDGDNVHINVDPANYCSANSIYCAFIRQFGVNKCLPVSDKTHIYVRDISRLDEAGFTVIPKSGTFRDFQKELDFIFDTLHCRIIHLLPINPVPTTYGRMGRYGSPYASLDYTAIDPALAEFDRKATPLEQLYSLVDDIHMKKGKVILDIAINHTGWASKIHETNPEWLKRDSTGKIVSPGAWGTTWEDLTELDKDRPELWKYFANVFTTWCERGIDGFRCDAGYMIPAHVWEYIIAKVRKQHPDTIFLLEGLGGDPKITSDLLDHANMNWAYSELFQNYDSGQIKNYLPEAHKTSLSDGLMVHYAETHDNERIAAKSHVYARMRTTLCALAAPAGAFGFANGVEWFATEKIDVHESSALNWGSGKNQIKNIARLNLILATHPAFIAGGHLKVITAEGTDKKFTTDILGFLRTSKKNKHPLLVLCNLNCEQKTRICFPEDTLNSFKRRTEMGVSRSQIHPPLFDMLTEKEWKLDPYDDFALSALLDPGQIICLTSELAPLRAVRNAERLKSFDPEYNILQQARAMVMDLLPVLGMMTISSASDEQIQDLAAALLQDPRGNFASLFDSSSEIPLVSWRCPEDLGRQVMVPPGHALFISATSRFRVEIGNSMNIIIQRDSLEDAAGNNFIILPPFPLKQQDQRLTLKISRFGEQSLCRESSEIIVLSNGDHVGQLLLSNRDIRRSHATFLSTNRRGAMLHIPVSFSSLQSRYDAILAANLHKDYPVDRRVMWSTCRMWIKNQTHVQTLSRQHISFFRLMADGKGCWNFHIPAGPGKFVDIRITMSMMDDRETSRVEIERLASDNAKNFIEDDSPVTLGIRVDIEDRSFHNITKAIAKTREEWPKAVKHSEDSFSFSPTPPNSLVVRAAKSPAHKDKSKNDLPVFKRSDEWLTDIERPLEAERGLQNRTDLFSPGYFEIKLVAGDFAILQGDIATAEDQEIEFKIEPRHVNHDKIDSFAKILEQSMMNFVVKRDDLKTVIAGYPWFLDWGRDTLICARGLVKAGFKDDVASIILAFARFAENGTLPNIIHGAEVGNRDTSDAPLWLFTACSDFIREFPEHDLLSQKIPGKDTSLLQVLEKIAESYISGTPNGIEVDASSGLVFSPSHFTWMDTNHPAGTPREGYPVEIQALWSAALQLLTDSTGDKKWSDMAEKTRTSALKLFVNDEGWLSDCLHAPKGTPAEKAVKDDALRPNQLLAITLGLVQDRGIRRKILEATSSLLVPGAIRSLANRPVNTPIEIKDSSGKLLNDPHNPYWGRYEGDEDTKRKPAYHNGTAWTWLFPSWPEAHFITYGDNGRQTAKSILFSAHSLLKTGCIGNIPEILDGDAPHRQRGCDAQAWGATEIFRVWQLLNK
ncbi:MAG: glycogen debranching enzyme N-terminal domain-containing protein [Victivallales bacterium]|nr:glycogen debranching enzyme N-terminal domain-containing protein [Victivallales bacterium]